MHTSESTIAWALLIFSVMLITPTTITYVMAIPYILMAAPEAHVLILFIPFAGFGLYCSWCIAINAKEYILYGTPLYLYIGIASGTFALYILIKTFGIFGEASQILNNPLVALNFGYGPIISSYVSLLIIYAMRCNTEHR